MRLEDYALLGNCQSAALVSSDGSIDWLCFPRFDSPACFAALLGDADNGRWMLRPREYLMVSRKYRQGTLILETEFRTAQGAVRIIDCMLPDVEVPTLIRMVEGIEGKVRMMMELVIRFDYGSIIPWVTRNPFGGVKAVAGPDTVRLRTTVPLTGQNLKTYADFEVSEAERIPFVMTWTPSHAATPSEIENPDEAITHCTSWWQEWISRCSYEGRYEDAVHRSLITLKALTYNRTGGMVAAPTTSLPEDLGGVRNWDYRYCWLRDSTFTLYSLLIAGYREEARGWKEWLLRAVAGTPSQVNVMYGLRGERRLTEFELPWLKGYEGSRPVRVGNGAHNQLQLDVFGELLDSFHVGRLTGLDTDKASWRVESKLVEFVEEAWKRPDSGIWEVRGPEQHFTHSKVMAWVAVDRAVKAVEQFGYEGPLERWKKVAAEMHAEICEKGFDAELGSFVQAYGSKTLDASLLLMALVGFLPADDARIKGTVNAIQKRLTRNGFVLRYSTSETADGLTGDEGAFIACTLWLADNLILQGRVEKAGEIFERVCSIRNDVGLLAEEYNTGLDRMVGNFPQAFSHVALINTAFNLAKTAVGPAEQRGSREAAPAASGSEL